MLDVGKPTVVLLSSGRPLTVPWLIERAQAVMALWFPGIETGNAVADLLLGRANPSGKLAISWPRSVGQIPIFYSERPTGRPFSTDRHVHQRLSRHAGDAAIPVRPRPVLLALRVQQSPHGVRELHDRPIRSRSKPTSPTPARWPARRPCCCSCATWWRGPRRR